MDGFELGGRETVKGAAEELDCVGDLEFFEEPEGVLGAGVVEPAGWLVFRRMGN